MWCSAAGNRMARKATTLRVSRPCWPVFRLQGEQKSFVDVLAHENGPLAELNEREKSLVLHRNAERLLESGVAVAA